jgi:transposase-like protein
MTSMTAGEGILVQDRVGRVRTPRARREALVEEYEKSGMSGVAFAEHVGMKYPTLASWVQKKRRQGQIEPKAPDLNNGVQWVEAVVEARPDAGERGSGLCIRFAGGAVMEIADPKGALLAAEVLRYLGKARVC